MGAREPAAGEIWIEGSGAVGRDGPRRAASLAVIPADRYAYALAGSLSIADNFVVANIRSGRYGGVALIDRSTMQQDAEAARRRLRRAGRAQHEPESRAAVRRQRPETRDRP